MKIKKIFFLVLLFLLILITKSNANEEIVNIELNKIADNYNNYPYVLALKDLGIKVKATQSGNEYTLTYNDIDSVIFSYSPTENMLYTTYAFPNRKNCDILCGIFVDCISNMQGNEVGSQLPFYFGDSFCKSFYRDDGISKEYISSPNGGIDVECKINPYKKLAIPQDKYEIDKSVFISNKLDFYNSLNCIAKSNGLICYKVVNDDGNIDLYIGQPDTLNNLAYYSIINAISLLASHDGVSEQKTIEYIKRNYPSFDNGNYEFDGIKVYTDITELPIQSQDTVLVGKNMKYAKFSIDIKLLESQASKIEIQTPSTNTTVKSEKSDNKTVVVIVVFLVIAFVIVFIVISAFIKRNR